MSSRYYREEEGQTLVEYGLLISLIALVVITVLTVMGQRLTERGSAPLRTCDSYTRVIDFHGQIDPLPRAFSTFPSIQAGNIIAL